MTTDESLTRRQTSRLQSTYADLSAQSLTSPHSEPLQALYARLAPSYDILRATWALSLGRRIEVAIDRWILRYLSPSLSVLDLACGTGPNLARLLRLGISTKAYLGIDSSPDMLQVAVRRFGHLPFATFRRMDLMDVDDSLGVFDLVICTYAFSHIDEPRRAVDTGLARLGPGGKAIFAFFREPESPLKEMFRLLEGPLTFRPVHREALKELWGARELARYQGVMMTALLLSAPSRGGNGR
jgi:SAM-dependent methyltransferase